MHESMELTRAQSLPTSNANLHSSQTKAPLSAFTADQQRFILKNSHRDFLVLDSHAKSGRNNTGAKMQFTEQPLNDNYMAVIRDSHAAVLSRHDLQNQRKKILDLDTESDTDIWNKIKRKKRSLQMSDRRKQKAHQTQEDLNFVSREAVNLQI